MADFLGSSDILRTIIGISLLVLSARLLAGVFEKIQVPGVVGEIAAGIALGPFAIGGAVHIFGGPLVELNSVFLAFAEVGVIILMLSAGLEFTFSDLRKSGISGFVVASLGAVTPFLLGYAVTLLLQLNFITALVVGATLTATSIAVTVAVLQEFQKMKTEEGRLLLSAAVIDDILGLAFLSMVVSVVQFGVLPPVGDLAFLLIRALGIWLVLLFAAIFSIPYILRFVAASRSEGALEAAATSVTFGLAAVAAGVGLSPVVGAFTAGMGVTGSSYRQTVGEFVSKLKLIFGPLFFAVIGTYLDPSQLLSTNLLLVPLGIAIAFVGKYVGCGLPAAYFLKSRSKGNRVGLGMVSRGEVGFIVLGTALTAGAIGQSVYSALLVVVLATTIISPILLKYSFLREAYDINITKETREAGSGSVISQGQLPPVQTNEEKPAEEDRAGG